MIDRHMENNVRTTMKIMRRYEKIENGSQDIEEFA